jgi:hypothetical protein
MSGRDPGRPSPYGRRLRVILILLLITWLPIVSFATVLALTCVTGCRIDEAHTYPCLFAVHDIGNLLYMVTMTGWVLIAFLPITALTLMLAVGQSLLLLLEAWHR